MRSVRMTIWVMVVVLASTNISKAALVGYVSTYTSNSVIFATDFDTGEQTPLGPSGINLIHHLDISPIDGTLYGLADYDCDLIKIDTTTGAGTTLGTAKESIGGFSFAPDGTLYGIGYYDNELVTIDTDTGVATHVAYIASPFGTVKGFSIDSSGRAIAWDQGAEWLFTIDLTNGSTTSLGYLPGNFGTFDFGPNDTLYASLHYNPGVYTIDLENLTSTRLSGFLSGDNAIAVTPEPATLFLLGVGGLMLRRKR